VSGAVVMSCPVEVVTPATSADQTAVKSHDGVPVSARTGTSLPHPSLWCGSSPRPSTICQPELSQCASLSIQHVWLSGVRLCRPDSLELAAWCFNLEILTVLIVLNDLWKHYSL